MLKSFVTEEDYPKLVDIIKKIRNKKFQNVSILDVYGGPASGKSTFILFLKKLSGGDFTILDPNLGESCLDDPNIDDYYGWPQSHLKAFEKSVTFCHDLTTNTCETILRKYHRMINKPLTYRSLYEDYRTIKIPATLIVATNTKKEIATNTHDKRIPLYIHFPYNFDGRTSADTVVECCLKESEVL